MNEKPKAKHPGGRPTKYHPKYCQSVVEYLKKQQDEDIMALKQSTEKGDVFENKLKVKLPTLEDFATFINVTQSTIYEWKNNHPEFSEACDKILREQKQRLIDKSLAGQYNAAIAKLILSANHNMRERTETDVTTNGKEITNTPPAIIINMPNGNDTDQSDS